MSPIPCRPIRKPGKTGSSTPSTSKRAANRAASFSTWKPTRPKRTISRRSSPRSLTNSRPISARGKQFLYHEGTHIPLVVRGPGIEKGKVRTDLIEHSDMAVYVGKGNAEMEKDFALMKQWAREGK
jgi:hypothetical protein